MKIPDYIQELIADQELYVLSTASKDGKPNTIYVKFLKVYEDEKILIANNKFFKTERNLAENPWMSFVVLNDETWDSYQIKGTCEFHEQDEIFEETLEWVKDKRPDPSIHPKSGLILNVEEIYWGAEEIAEE